MAFWRSAFESVRKNGVMGALREAKSNGYFCGGRHHAKWSLVPEVKNVLFLVEVPLPANTGNTFVHRWKRIDPGLQSALLDGNLLETKLHTIGATLVGEDKMGNKYYEKLENNQYGRHRWVEYASTKHYNASAVPPEWHGWLHYITDRPADQLEDLKPTRYGLPHKENMSGRGDGMIYHSKGHALNPNRRDWKRYQSWQPENPDSDAKSSVTTQPTP